MKINTVIQLRFGKLWDIWEIEGEFGKSTLQILAERASNSEYTIIFYPCESHLIPFIYNEA